MSDDNSTQLQLVVQRMQAGDPAAHKELIGRAYQRLRALAATILKDFPRSPLETGDLADEIAVRLMEDLKEARPPTARDFFALAAWKMRNLLIDAARGKTPVAFQPWAPAGISERGAVNEPAAGSNSSPSMLARWTEFHEQVEKLPEEEREVFDLVYYQGLTQEEASAILEVSVKTVKRRWRAARLLLHEALHGELPGS